MIARFITIISNTATKFLIEKFKIQYCTFKNMIQMGCHQTMFTIADSMSLVSYTVQNRLSQRNVKHKQYPWTVQWLEQCVNISSNAMLNLTTRSSVVAAAASLALSPSI